MRCQNVIDRKARSAILQPYEKKKENDLLWLPYHFMNRGGFFKSCRSDSFPSSCFLAFFFLTRRDLNSCRSRGYAESLALEYIHNDMSLPFRGRGGTLVMNCLFSCGRPGLIGAEPSKHSIHHSIYRSPGYLLYDTFNSFTISCSGDAFCGTSRSK